MRSLGRSSSPQRLAFTRSCAVMSIIGFSVGLGDRHLENILIDSTSGVLMHVDFACLFDHGLNLETPEKVPFRLTQNLLHAMGVRGADGVFRRVAELTLEQLRANRPTLLTVLSTMRHDPLVEWSKRNVQEDASGVRESDEAEKELEKVDLKLQGINQLRGPTAMSVEGQVSCLINEATNIQNLCQMYIWYALRACPRILGLRALHRWPSALFDTTWPLSRWRSPPGASTGGCPGRDRTHRPPVGGKGGDVKAGSAGALVVCADCMCRLHAQAAPFSAVQGCHSLTVTVYIPRSGSDLPTSDTPAGVSPAS